MQCDQRSPDTQEKAAEKRGAGCRLRDIIAVLLTPVSCAYAPVKEAMHGCCILSDFACGFGHIDDAVFSVVA